LTTEHRLSGKAITRAHQYKLSRVFCFQSGHDAQARNNPNFYSITRGEPTNANGIVLFPSAEDRIGGREGHVECRERLGGLLKYYRRAE
jgi:hypothetical protein